MRAVSVFAFQVIDFLVYLFVVFNQLTRRRLTTISYLLVISESAKSAARYSECSCGYVRMLLAMPRSDEFRTAIPRQVARQDGLPSLHRPSAMLKRLIDDVKRACPPQKPLTVQTTRCSRRYS
jgi:hypothetical protein